MKVYTKRGDKGETGLLFGGRVSKADPRCEAYGATDTAVSAMGLARALCENEWVKETLLKVQREMFTVGAELATDPSQYRLLRDKFSVVTADMVTSLEGYIDEVDREIDLPRAFIVPGGSPGSGALDLARSLLRTAERRVVALDEQGNFLWSFPPSGEDQLTAIYSTPAVSEGRVYIADYDNRLGTGTLYAVRAESDTGGGGGELLWQQDMGGPVVGGITVADSVVFVGSSDNHLYAFDSFSGEPLSGFPFLAQGQVWSTPAVANGLVYFGSLDHNVYAVRLSDGAEFWRFETEAGVASSPLVSNGKVYIGSFDRNFYAIDAATGVENWRFTAENWFWGGAVTDDERIYAA